MKLHLNNNLSYAALWLAAAVLALALAFASPNEAAVMGRLPAYLSHTLTKQPLALPSGLPSDRTLALITFQKEQRAQAESWVKGLKLQDDASISWVRMPVITDPGNARGRDEVETRLLKHYPMASERARLVPVFTDRAEFARAAALSGGANQFHAVVVNREGDVLARVEGQFDEVKAQALRETLRETLQTKGF